MPVIREAGNMLKNTIRNPDNGIIVLLIVGFFLRFYRFSERIGWWGDVAADHLMARHIVHFGEFPVLGHPASGFIPPFYYPPYYYYIMAGLTFVLDHYLFRIGFFTLMHVVGIVALYHIGVRLGGRMVGFLSALFFTVSLRMIIVSQVSTPPYAVVPILLLLLWGYIEIFRRVAKSVEAKKYGWMKRYMLHAGLLFAVTWYWGVAVFLPFALGVEVYQQRSLKSRIVSIFAFCILAGLIFSPLWVYFGIPRLIALGGTMTGGVSFSADRILSSVWIFFSDFFFYDPVRTKLALVAGIILIGTCGRRTFTYLRTMILPTTLISVFLGSTVFLSRPLHDHDVHSVQALFFLILTGFVVKFAADTASVWRKGIALCSFAGIFFLVWDPVGFIHYRSNQYEQYADIARAIEQQVMSGSVLNFRITVITPVNDTNDHLAIWYILEERQNRRYLVVVPEGYNFEERTGDIVRIVVCLQFPKNGEAACRNTFEESYPQYVYSNTLPYDTQKTMVYMYTRKP